MASNPYVNKVEYGNQTVMDISDTTVEESDVAEGEVFYKATGERSAGTGNYYSPNDATSSSIFNDDYIPYYRVSNRQKNNMTFSNFVQVIKSRLRSYFSTFSYPRKIVEDTVGWACLNLLEIPPSVETQEISGVTFEVARNNEGQVDAIVASGIATDDIYFSIRPRQRETIIYDSSDPARYKAGLTDEDLQIFRGKLLYYNHTEGTSQYITHNNQTLYIDPNGEVEIFIVIEAGTDLNGVIFQPYIYESENPSTQIVPFRKNVNEHLTNKYDAQDPSENTIDDTDYFPFYDKSASEKRNTTWSNIKSKLKEYFDTIYSTFSGSYNDLSNKPGVVSTSANGFTPKVTDTSKYLKGDGTWDTPTNTNNAVTQTATSTNANYEVLFSATADNTTRTKGARKNSNLKFNPSTGNLQATQLNGVTIGSSPKFTDTTYSSKAAASGGTDVSLCTTGEKYTWNNKQKALSAPTAYIISESINKAAVTLATGSNDIDITGVTKSGYTALCAIFTRHTSVGSIYPVKCCVPVSNGTVSLTLYNNSGASKSNVTVYARVIWVKNAW